MIGVKEFVDSRGIFDDAIQATTEEFVADESVFYFFDESRTEVGESFTIDSLGDLWAVVADGKSLLATAEEVFGAIFDGFTKAEVASDAEDPLRVRWLIFKVQNYENL